MARRILVARHGQAYNTVDPDGARPVSDPVNPPLTPLGEQQAQRLAQVFEDFAPQVTVVSPFLRTTQTAAFAKADNHGPVVFDTGMCEYFGFDTFADFKGFEDRDYQRVLAPPFLPPPEALAADSYPTYPETGRQVLERCSAVVQDWKDRDDWERLAFVGHGASVGGVTDALLPPDAPRGKEVLHACVTVLEETPDGWVIIKDASIEHLEGLHVDPPIPFVPPAHEVDDEDGRDRGQGTRGVRD